MSATGREQTFALGRIGDLHQMPKMLTGSPRSLADESQSVTCPIIVMVASSSWESAPNAPINASKLDRGISVTQYRAPSRQSGMAFLIAGSSLSNAASLTATPLTDPSRQSPVPNWITSPGARPTTYLADTSGSPSSIPYDFTFMLTVATSALGRERRSQSCPRADLPTCSQGWQANIDGCIIVSMADRAPEPAKLDQVGLGELARLTLKFVATSLIGFGIVAALGFVGIVLFFASTGI